MAKQITDYFRSKKFTGDCHVLGPILGPERLVDVQKKLEKVEKGLLESRGRHKLDIRIIAEEWTKLEETGKKIRDDFKNFNEFVENNIKKRQRANIQLKQLNVVNRLRDLEIAKMSDRLKKIKILTNKLEENIKSHGIYPKFLDDLVREYPKKFVEPIDVIFSYRELMQVNDEAMERFRAKFAQFQGDKENYVRHWNPDEIPFNLIPNTTIIGQRITKLPAIETIDDRFKITEHGEMRLRILETKRAALTKRHEEARRSATYLEYIVSCILSRVARLYMEKTATLMAARKLQEFSCRRKNRKIVDLEKRKIFDGFKGELEILRRLTKGLVEQEWGQNSL